MLIIDKNGSFCYTDEVFVKGYLIANVISHRHGFLGNVYFPKRAVLYIWE